MEVGTCCLRHYEEVRKQINMRLNSGSEYDIIPNAIALLT